MGRKKHKTSKSGKAKSIRAVLIVDDERATPERALKTVTGMTGTDHGNGLQLLDAELTVGGTVLRRAHYNTCECLLDLIKKDGLLQDRAEDETETRRYLAGLSLRYLYERAEMESNTTAVYEKGGNSSISGPPRKSESADKAEAAYHTLMSRMGIYGPIVRNVCCLSEDARGTRDWLDSLRRGLDRLADELYGRSNSGRIRARKIG